MAITIDGAAVTGTGTSLSVACADRTMLVVAVAGYAVSGSPGLSVSGGGLTWTNQPYDDGQVGALIAWAWVASAATVSVTITRSGSSNAAAVRLLGASPTGPESYVAGTGYTWAATGIASDSLVVGASAVRFSGGAVVAGTTSLSDSGSGSGRRTAWRATAAGAGTYGVSGSGSDSATCAAAFRAAHDWTATASATDTDTATATIRKNIVAGASAADVDTAAAALTLGTPVDLSTYRDLHIAVTSGPSRRAVEVAGPARRSVTVTEPARRIVTATGPTRRAVTVTAPTRRTIGIDGPRS